MNRKIHTLYISILCCFLALNAYGQKKPIPTTNIDVPSDTTKVPEKQNETSPDDPNLRLPDVLILGKDEYHRTEQSKKNVHPESPILMQPGSVSQPLSTWFKKDSEKPHLGKADTTVNKQSYASLLGGSYFTILGDGVHWQRFKDGDFRVHAWFERSEGQYVNSKYAQGQLSGKISYMFAPKLIGMANVQYDRSSRGLYDAGYRTKNAVHNTGMGFLSGDLSYDINDSSDVNIGFECGGISLKSDTSHTQIDKTDDFWYRTHLKYFVQLNKSQISAEGRFIRETIKAVADSSSDKVSFGEIKAELLQPISKTFSVAIGLNYQIFEQDTVEQKALLSPFARLNFFPSNIFGLTARLSTGYNYTKLYDYVNENNYLAHNIPIYPTQEKFAFLLKCDFKLSTKIKLIASFAKSWMDRSFYWQSDIMDGLIHLNILKNSELTEIKLGAEIELSEKTTLQAYYIDYSDQIDSDSENLDDFLNRIPYRPDFHLPVRATIKLLPDMFFTTKIDLVGERKTHLEFYNTLPAYVSLDIDVTKGLSKNIMAVLSVRNLFDSHYSVWEGYPEMGVALFAGLEAKF